MMLSLVKDEVMDLDSLMRRMVLMYLVRRKDVEEEMRREL